MDKSIGRLCACLAVAALIAGCGGGGTATSTATTAPAATTAAATTAAVGAMGGAMTGAMSEGMPLAKAAPVPANLTCKGAIVWVNMKSKAYHMAGDPYYGRTKNGEYMCQAGADAKGYHKAGMEKMHMKAATGTMGGAATTAPAPAST